MNESGEYFTPLELATEWKLSTDAIYDRIKSGELEAQKFGGSYRVSPEQKAKYLADTNTTNIYNKENKDLPKVRRIRNSRKAKQCA